MINQRDYYKDRVLNLMNEVETKHNRYNKPAIFEIIFPELTQEIWNAIDSTYKSQDHKPLARLVEKLNKLSDSF